MAKSLERYLVDSMTHGITKHRLVAKRNADGLVEFFIHALDVRGGETRTFVTYDAAVVPRGDNGGPPVVAVAQQAAA